MHREEGITDADATDTCSEFCAVPSIRLRPMRGTILDFIGSTKPRSKLTVQPHLRHFEGQGRASNGWPVSGSFCPSPIFMFALSVGSRSVLFLYMTCVFLTGFLLSYVYQGGIAP